MSEAAVTAEPSEDRDPFEELAEEFLQRRRRGENVSIAEYADRHPDLAQQIRDLFPTLLLMEDLKPVSGHSKGTPPASGRGETAIQRLGDYRILREIGRGGMGVVYEAEQESLGRRVALKVLPAMAGASPTRVRRFQREAQAAARLHHTNIVPVFGVGYQEGAHYYVMQYIAGQGLDRVLKALSDQAVSAKTVPGGEAGTWPDPQGPCAEFTAADAARMLLAGPPSAEAASSSDGRASQPVLVRPTPPVAPDHRYWRRVARIGIQAADALEYAHRQGTLHRDIKPANLLLDEQGTVWITDFGLAKLAEPDDLTRSGDMVGTLRYMAPEQFEGKADRRSDVYGLGLTLYELITLRPAFDENDRGRLIRQVTQEEPPRPRKFQPGIPRDLETIVLKAIAPRPHQRYATAGELAADLRCFLEDRPIRARRVTLLGRAWRWCRRNRAVAALTAAALTLLVAVAVVASAGYLRTRQALQRVSQEREQAQAARRQAETERERTKTEQQRAEANLRLATKAFEDIFAKIAPDPIAHPLERTDDEEAWPEPVWQYAITDKDAALLESLLKFYDQFAQQNHADVRLQKETAKAYRRVGDIRRRLGQYEKAETAYRRALEAYQHLAEAAPNDAESSTAVASIYNELGLVCRSMGRFAEQRTLHLQAQKTLQQQSAQVAALAESRFELARTYGFLSLTVPDPGTPSPRGHRGPRRPGPSLGQFEAAAENNRRALEILTKLTEEVPADPRYRLALARTHRDAYLLAAFSGRFPQADACRQEAIRILQSLVAEAPNHPDYQHELAETYAMPATPWHDQHTAAASSDELRRALDILAELVARYPTVPEYKASLARACLRFGEIHRSGGSVTGAEDELTRAVELFRSLVAEFPSMIGYRFFLGRSLDRLAEVQRARGQLPQARATLEEAIANTQKLQELSPGMARFGGRLPMQYASLARVLRELGEHSLAEEAAAKAGSYPGRSRLPAFGPEAPRAPTTP